MADIKELIPEFFYLPDFLLNNNKFDLGKEPDTKSPSVVFTLYNMSSIIPKAWFPFSASARSLDKKAPDAVAKNASEKELDNFNSTAVFRRHEHVVSVINYSLRKWFTLPYAFSSSERVK